MERLDTFIKAVEKKLCGESDGECSTRVRNLSGASSLDISYDTISHALKVTALWPHGTQSIKVAATGEHRVEVGVFGTDSNAGEAHEIGLGGVLVVLGEHTKPSVHTFTIPTRHRQSGAAGFSAKFLSPAGLHPTLQLTIHSSRPPPVLDHERCALHAYLTLPKAIFADRYQLSDSLFMASKNLSSLRYASSPVDLERPEYATGPWGSSILLELAPPSAAEDWTADIPLHLRYLPPSEEGYLDLDVPYPTLFWACTAEDGTLFPNNPFERVDLGYDGLFGPRTVFWHLNPRPAPGASSDRLVSSLLVPVLQIGNEKWIELGTSAAISLGFAWIMVCLVLVNWGSRDVGGKRAGHVKKTQ